MFERGGRFAEARALTRKKSAPSSFYDCDPFRGSAEVIEVLTERRRARRHIHGPFCDLDSHQPVISKVKGQARFQHSSGSPISGKMKTQSQSRFPCMSPPEFGVVGNPCVRDRTDLTNQTAFSGKGQGRSNSTEKFSAKLSSDGPKLSLVATLSHERGDESFQASGLTQPDCPSLDSPVSHGAVFSTSQAIWQERNWPTCVLRPGWIGRFSLREEKIGISS